MDALQVFHVPKTAKSGRVSESHLAFRQDSSGFYPGFYMDTCQRWVWMCADSPASPGTQAPLAQDSPVEVFRGYEAYLFLLRFAAGLESEVQGETDIFGQIKEAWRNEKSQNRSLTRDLEPWMQRLFEDTKDIRSRFLQNVGGSSYGTLTRKIIKNSSKTDSDGPVLIVGAGKIARSIAPLLLDHDLWLWNRNAEKLSPLYSELSRKSKSSVQQFSCNDEQRVWKEAKHIVVCIPLNPSQDEKRIAWFREGGNLAGRSIIHLGGRKPDCGAWNSLPLFHSLDELFELEKSAGNVRSIQISKAVKACEERAKLRSLGLSLSITHGWEDLASFA
ncbi:MAG: hypothetical protein ABIQ95_06835 [Bdellovibrionia bacterium]